MYFVVQLAAVDRLSKILGTITWVVYHTAQKVLATFFQPLARAIADNIDNKPN
jgi:hypothetical protein